VAAARTQPTEESSAQESGFTDAQRSELRDIIAEVVGGAKAPAPEPKAPRTTEAEYDRLTDRQRERLISEQVADELLRLRNEDELLRQRDEIDALKADRKPEPEATPSVVSRIQKILWGEPDK
jgi:hypothetical protein